MIGLGERAALITLLRRADRPWPEITDLVERAGSASAALDDLAAPGGQRPLFDTGVQAELELSRTEIASWAADGLRLVTILDDEYPSRLRLVHQRPPFLFARGTLAGDDLAVAVVGTRKPSPAGLTLATDVADGLARRGVTVVSGLAAGVDTAAHRAALAAGGRTVAVIGTGIRRSYPAQNADLQREIASRGLVISQFWPDAPPTKQSFPMRNTVMSGYTLATVVIEAAYQSGARMQARLALQHGRRVFLMQSLLAHEWARDYAKMPNTRVVDGPGAVFDALDAVRAEVDDLVWA